MKQKKDFFLGKEMERTSNLYSALWLSVNFGTFLSSRYRDAATSRKEIDSSIAKQNQ